MAAIIAKIKAFLTPEFLEDIQGTAGHVIRFFWPTKADTIIEKIGTVFGIVLTILGALAALG